ncbi:MAG: hypothetical protein SBU_000145 [Candidatus Syntrophoarchaeum butanivorans]|uniref:Uncharacterized protein n=1 Tax=Candidatus Syntropharchaeum butanivorans TaxID=1839936 RepID=A0A1F2P795_9EURY|nr:MAG: hypothetical protein SBU_000145 [Candidatus Syntrophoarchaeum butanivorans]
MDSVKKIRLSASTSGRDGGFTGINSRDGYRRLLSGRGGGG